ncbi:unnamed protein product [Sympodiomycopsis kandeliae]
MADSSERPFTPADEFSSWLPEEMCVACGAPISTSQLYCSEECKHQEQRNAAQATQERLASLRISPTASSASRSGQLDPATADKSISDAPTQSALHNEPRDQPRFRYHFPTSPHLLAQRKSTVHSAQEAPGLTAFERSLLSDHGEHARGPDSTASSNEGSGSANERRNSAMSSASSFSSIATDPSTPSPTILGRRTSQVDTKNGEDFDNSEEGLNDSNFRLPPAVTSSNAALMRRVSSKAPFESKVPDPSSTISKSYHETFGTGECNEPDVGLPITSPTMSYARRPSCTNVPTPILYSPAMMAKAASAQKASPTSTRRRSAWNVIGTSSAGVPQRRRTGAHSRGPSVIDGLSVAAEVGKKNHVNPSSIDVADSASEGTMKRSVSDPAPTSSPQQHALGSASSSATCTLRAASPDMRSSAGICGRPGCTGSSVIRESTSMKAMSAFDVSTSRSMTNHGNRAENTRPGAFHRHTHSARAGLDMPLGEVKHVSAHDPSSKTALSSVTSDASFQRDAAKLIQSKEVDEHHAEIDDHNGAMQGRGRSKARNCRSVSRRSRSPPRAAARGRSKVLHLEEIGRKGRIADSPPRGSELTNSVSPVNGSQKMDLGHSDKGYPSSSAGEDLDEEMSSPRRGRRRRFSTVKAGRVLHVPADATSTAPLQERQQGLQRGRAAFGRSRPLESSKLPVDPGFHEVEDLDLER